MTHNRFRIFLDGGICIHEVDGFAHEFRHLFQNGVPLISRFLYFSFTSFYSPPACGRGWGRVSIEVVFFMPGTSYESRRSDSHAWVVEFPLAKALWKEYKQRIV
jgi:hypothetical protein